MTADDYPHEHIEFGAVCLSCKHTQHPLKSIERSYLEGKEIRCTNHECKKPLNYWKATLDFIGGEGIPTILLNSVGAQETFFQISLREGEVKYRCGLSKQSSTLTG